MLTFEEKMEILNAFPELTMKEVSLGRVNYHYEDSVIDKKNVVYHLHPNGNGFVYAGQIHGMKTDEKGMVNIREYSAQELREIVAAAIESMSPQEDPEEMTMEEWTNENDQVLVIMKEDGGWNIYAGLELEGAFNTYPEAADFLEKEGFTRA
ncbi:hypothetical protein [Salibacterium halotolerans]|uniref:Uncharacterized protein n=1 Tax=Salibacterium halotolerans TaxID=1884432 RepID=A0A1I5RS21_9BACI|nr:hypothetical protein [Salibacterium halotolerans]SFP61315.1 hypothetical protein SAMN05518683_107150 [Salibacterium halotolerans]